MKLAGWLLIAVMASAAGPCGGADGARTGAFNPSPHAIDVPPWFRETFLDFREDVREAARDGKRVMIYFGQDGCPYCRRLMQVNFGQKDIADAARRHFHAIAVNLWGDREVTWTDGAVLTEKTIAARLKVQFTPTLLFLDERGEVVLRLNGYYPPHRFRAALDYVAGRHERSTPFADYLRAHAREPAEGRLHPQPFLLEPPLDLDRGKLRTGRLLAVLFEQEVCGACDELHREGFAAPEMKALIPRFDMARVTLFGAERLVTPDGRLLTAREWGRALGVAYTPTIVFFDAGGREVFRIEAYLRPFHLVSSFEYVASGAYRIEPSFQRYLQARAEKIRAAGGRVELW